METMFGQKLMKENARDMAYALFFIFAIGFVALLSTEASKHLPK
ncbi:MAG TPA: hypothetical protein VGS28_02875 [Candidatus Saccharimonadales bacterium]|nr:hypothetical protein [Candidatus Saccharimonadales bacterium]